MKTYRVARRCYGYQRRLWREGQIVTLPDDETPPHHFERIDGPVEEPKQDKDKPLSLGEMAKTPQVTGGMNAGLPQAEEPKTRRRSRN